MSRARLTASLLRTLAASALTLSSVTAQAATQGGRAVVVQSLLVDARLVQTVDDVRVTAPGKATPDEGPQGR